MPVLIVDDDEINRRLLEECLLGWQIAPSARGHGLAALDAIWHRTASGRPYALLLLDSRMPDTDGLTLAATIRERVELADTRIILMTSGEGSRAILSRLRELRIDARLQVEAGPAERVARYDLPGDEQDPQFSEEG